MANAPTSVQTLISNAAVFTPITESDVIRWAIDQLNIINTGGVGDNTPTISQVSASIGQWEVEQSPKMLSAILLQLLIGLVGAGSGGARVLTGSVSPNGNVFAPPGTLYTQVVAPGFGTIFTKTSAVTLNTGWI
jgi:hypothetical protein